MSAKQQALSQQWLLLATEWPNNNKLKQLLLAECSQYGVRKYFNKTTRRKKTLLNSRFTY